MGSCVSLRAWWLVMLALPESKAPMSQPGWRAFQFRAYAIVWLLAVGFNVAMHVQSFRLPHTEGDEFVYLTLAHQMHWDLSHYTTRDDAEARLFRDAIYRGPLFHHPPLYPLILKTGQTLLHDGPLAGLLFANATMALLLFYTWRWLAMQRMPVAWGAIAMAGVTLCPLLLSSTTLLHHDALMGCFMACGLVAFLEALDRPTVGRAIIAGLLLTIGLNLRYNALIFLPCLFALQLHHACRDRPTDATDPTTATTNRWLVFGIVMAMVMTLGLQHYYRVLATYGSLLPSRFLHPDADLDTFSPYLRMVSEQTPMKTVLELLRLYPILLAYLIPATYIPVWNSLRAGRGAAVFTPIFLYLLAVEFFFSYSQIRYFAAITPCLYLALPWLIRQQPPWNQKIWAGLTGLSLLLMLVNGLT